MKFTAIHALLAVATEGLPGDVGGLGMDGPKFPGPAEAPPACPAGHTGIHEGKEEDGGAFETK